MAVADTLKPALTRASRGMDPVPINDASACMSEILAEIDMIVLPRDLILENGAGRSLSLTVKSRRLLRAHIPGMEDQDLNGADLNPLCRAFAEFARGATAVTAKPSKPAQPEALSDLGVPVTMLREALSDAGHLPQEQGQTVLPALSRLADAHELTCMLYEECQMTASNGAPDELRMIHDVALPHILKTERPEQGRAASWILGSAQGDCVALTVEGAHCFVAALPVAMTQDWIKAATDGSVA